MPTERRGIKAGGLLWLPDSGLVLVKRLGSGRDGLVIPKGGPKSGDLHLGETAEREMWEETGFKAQAALFLGVVVRDSIDVDSPEAHKSINVYAMNDGVRDETAAPDEIVEFVPDPTTADFERIMRYPEEAHFIATHLATVMRSSDI